MFQVVKGLQKGDLKFAVEEFGKTVPPESTIATLKEIILNSNEYKADPNFVQEILSTVVIERKEIFKFEQENELKLEEEKLRLDQEKLRLYQEKEIELKKSDQQLK